MGKPILLDLFCKAGGAGTGYHRAGFRVVGVDTQPQKRYPFEFVQGDALEFCRDHGGDFDAIHASPPCQAYSRSTAWRGDRSRHPDLIAECRAVLGQCDRPSVIENVQEARGLMHFPLMLCGSMFNLRVRRHRYFETNKLPLILVPPCQHLKSDFSHDHGGKQTEDVYRNAMGCEWMSVHESRQAIPPAYTEYIGKQLIRLL